MMTAFGITAQDMTVYGLRGRVLDSERIPIGSAVVSLLRNDSTLIAHTITDSNGRFELRTEYIGKAILCTNHISFKPYKKLKNYETTNFINL